MPRNVHVIEESDDKRKRTEKKDYNNYIKEQNKTNARGTNP